MAPSKTTPLHALTVPFRLAKSPWVTGPLLLAILYHPEKLQSIVPKSLYPLITSPAFIKTLKIFLGISVVSKLNQKLSQLSFNNWKSDAKFVKSQELVLITGGSSGIGELMARYFAKVGVKVVILDVSPPKGSLGKLPSN
jgi:all-trans-retinol dehydrogenase (NAD+)